MEKPIELSVRELKEDIVKIINDYKLPPFIIRPIIQEIYNSVVNMEQQNYEQAKENYEKQSESGE